MKMHRIWPGLVSLITWLALASDARAAVTASGGGVGNVVVGNTGTGAATISHTTATATDTVAALVKAATADCNAFTVTAALPATLMNTDTLAVTVGFTPAAAMAYSCRVSVQDGGGGELTSFTATGTGQIGNFTFAPSPLVVGTVEVGAAPVINNGGTITNTGSAPILLLTGTITGPNAADFSFTNAPTSGCNLMQTCNHASRSIAASGTLAIPVRCTPAAPGLRSATLTFTTSGAGNGSSFDIPLQCTATQAQLVLAPGTHNYGSVAVNTSSPTTVMVQNPGSAVLRYSVAETAGDVGDFSNNAGACTPGSPCTVAAGSSASHTFTFLPTADGARSAVVTVTSHNPGTVPAQNLTLSGNGFGAELTLVAPAGGALVFGAVTVGTPAQLPVTLRNDGNADLTVSSITFSRPEYTLQSPLPTINPAQQGTVNVQCLPTARGPVPAATMTINNNSYNQPARVINLSCSGQNGELRTNPVTVDFGNLAFGMMATRTFLLENIGELPVTINTGASVITPAGAGYTINPAQPVPASLAPGASATVGLIFAPVVGAEGGDASLPIVGSSNTAIVQIRGNGLSNGIDVNPSTIDLGMVRWDQQSAPRTITITNTGTNPFTITSVTSSSGEFVLSAPSTTVLGGGAMATFTVTGDPSDTATNVVSGMITVVSNLASDNTRVINVSMTVTQPMLVVEPAAMMLDFGGVDIDSGMPGSLDVTLRNTGNAPMRVAGRAGVPATGFAAVQPFAAIDVNPGEFLTTTVTYQPTMETTAAAAQTGNLVFTMGGVRGTAAVTLPMRGYGVDRHIAVAPTLDLGSEYRNPGTLAVPVPLMVNNSGEAPLMINSLNLTGDPSISYVGTPGLVAGLGSTSYPVTFAPSAESGTFTAMLQIAHDDDDVPPQLVTLTGTAKRREVDLTKLAIELPLATVGVNYQVGGELVLTNSNTAARTFRVAGLVVTDPTLSLGVEVGTQDQLMPAVPVSYVLDYTPSQPGPFTATIAVLLDEDPVPHATVTVTGYAVESGAQGGGGCDGGGGGAGWALALLVAAGLLGRRRGLAVALGAGAALSALGAARADDTIDVSTFQPLPSIEDELFTVEPATTGRAGAWAVGAMVSYATNLLEVVPMCPAGDATCEGLVAGRQETPVETQLVTALGGAYVVAGRYELGLTVPLLQQTGTDRVFAVEPAEGTTLGDVALKGKTQLLSRGIMGLGVGAGLTLPTAKDDQYAGSAWPTLQVTGLASWRTRKILASFNAGFLMRKSVELGTAVRQGSEVTYGGGLGYRVLERVWLAGELFGGVGVIDVRKANLPLQAALGARIRFGAVGIGLGAGTGVVAGVGVPALRGFLQVTFSPQARPMPPLHPPPPPPDTGDRDADGVVNFQDKCPDEAEDKDAFQDEDGCVERDNDGDGMADDLDKCPLEAEDRDGFQDDDGCVDPDNDSDGVPDGKDKCVNDPEDADGHADTDGCADPDNDGDGILDAADRCVDKPETINGKADDDGCPDGGESAILLAADRIELFEAIKFQGVTDKPAKNVGFVLGQVGAMLRAHPEIVRVRITAHVHKRGTREEDQALSVARGNAIKAWLVNWGIAAGRLDVRGFGSDKPLVKSGRNAEVANDRIEFVIMEKN
jgi:hypothetical protein